MPSARLPQIKAGFFVLLSVLSWFELLSYYLISDHKLSNAEKKETGAFFSGKMPPVAMTEMPFSFDYLGMASPFNKY